MRAAINANLLRNLPKGNHDIWDLKLRGFVLRVRASGQHSYRCEFARGRRVTLGSAAELSPAQARLEARKVLGDCARGIDPLAAKRQAKAHTWGSFMREVYAPWILAQPGRRRHHIVLRLRVFSVLDGLKLGQITPWHIEKHRTARLKAGRKAGTINREVSELHVALTRAVQWGHVKAHPLSNLRPLKTDKRPRVRYLSADERSRLLSALAKRDERIKAERESGNAWRRERGYNLRPDLRACRFADHLEPMVLVSLNTGLRRGELFALQWGDVNLPGRMLTVRGETSKSKQTRHLPLNDAAFAALVAWHNQTAGEGLIFPNDQGRVFDNCNKAWRHLLKDAGISGFRWHDMRHDFASKLVMSGVSLSVVRELLGHASADMVLRYAHLSEQHKADAVQRLCG